MAASLKIVTSIEATDERTVRFSLAQPSATFFSTLTSPYAGIVSPAAVQASGADFAQKPVGSGPFKLAEWQPGVAITLERNPDYSWGPPSVKNKGAPHIDTAVFKVIPDAATQLSALQAGEVDIIFLNQPDHITRLAGEASIQLIPVSLNSLAYLGFNCQKPPFDDVKVRQAFSHAIDKDAIVQTAVGGQGTPAFAPMATTLLGFSDSLKELELGYDPEKAKALLAEAGFSQGADGAWAKDGQPLQVTLLTFTRAPNQDVATVIQSQLKEIGVPATIEQFDSPTASKAATEGKYDLLLWRYDWNDPDVLNVNLSSTRIGSTNRVFYSNPTVDELLGKASGEFDNEARARLYLEAQRAIMADAPWQPLYTPVDMLAVTGRVQGIVISSMGRVLLNDVTIAE
jgi:peptide/nickel transport system substrate-binding protein